MGIMDDIHAEVEKLRAEREAAEDQKISEQPRKHRTAKQWAEISGFSYRVILSAIKNGAMEAYRPSGTSAGTIYVSPDAFEKWLEKIRLRVDVPVSEGRRVSMDASAKKTIGSRPIEEFALSLSQQLPLK